MRLISQVRRFCVVILFLISVAMPVFATPPVHELREFQDEAMAALNKGGRESLSKVMRKYGWSPMTLHPGEEINPSSQELGIMALNKDNLTLSLYAFRNDRKPRQFAVYSEYTWRAVTEMYPASEDVLGLEWLNSTLQPLSTGKNSDNITYTGRSPAQQVVVFTVSDPMVGKRSGTAWVVLEAPSSITNGTKLSFNTLFDHTYETSQRTETWGASITWDPKLTGSLSYTVQLQKTETKWQSGTLWYCTWPCG